MYALSGWSISLWVGSIHSQSVGQKCICLALRLLAFMAWSLHLWLFLTSLKGHKTMQKSNEITVFDETQKPSLWERAKNFGGRAKESLALALATVLGLLMTQPALAAELDFSGATAELDGVKTTIIALIGLLVVIWGIGLAWSYFKRTAR